MTEDRNEVTRVYAITNREYDYNAIVLNISAVRGFQAAVAVKDELIVAENNKSSVDLEALVNSITGVSELVTSNIQELKLGSFHTGEIDGPWGHIYITVLGDITVITQCDQSGQGEDVLARLERIITSCSKEI